MIIGDQMVMVYMLEGGASEDIKTPCGTSAVRRSRLVYGSRVRKLFGVPRMRKEDIICLGFRRIWRVLDRSDKKRYKSAECC